MERAHAHPHVSTAAFVPIAPLGNVNNTSASTRRRNVTFNHARPMHMDFLGPSPSTNIPLSTSTSPSSSTQEQQAQTFILDSCMVDQGLDVYSHDQKRSAALAKASRMRIEAALFLEQSKTRMSRNEPNRKGLRRLARTPLTTLSSAQIPSTRHSTQVFLDGGNNNYSRSVAVATIAPSKKQPLSGSDLKEAMVNLANYERFLSSLPVQEKNSLHSDVVFSPVYRALACELFINEENGNLIHQWE
eukprot:CAMPEP_0184692026 /NCGR_PEP_ID=MMETSP0313-20130426/671_1 /TAXON_ID=2792 /ORGANISM="Porphyridium aerugineum, Strain SAG 1380-2" /LENGTH=244 /DNA_ID=CAMNT_0027149821 /DNA_START=647 /DNA_END=1381 /DNA_ORIENTATION=+